MKKISIVVPVYNEQENINIFYSNFKRLVKKENSLKKFELIFVDDGSSDNSSNQIKEIIKNDNSVKLLSLTRNNGVNIVFSAGLDAVSGDCMIFMDADNQYPMSIIRNFVLCWQNGEKIIFARRSNYAPGILSKTLTVAFVKFLNSFSSLNLDHRSSYVCLIDKEIVNILKNLNEKTRYYPGLIRWTGFNVAYIDCDIQKRKRGNSKIGMRKKFGEAISALTDFTAAPLRMWTVIGLIISSTSMLYGFFILYLAFKNGVEVPGYTSIFLAVVFMGGLQLFSLGVLSEYITKIYIEGKKRPSYLIKERIGFKKSDEG